MSAPPPSSVESVAFIEREGRLVLRLGGRAVEGGRMSPALETELLGGLETVLRTRHWRGARSAVALDDRGRRLDIRQAEGHLVLSVLDPGERCIVDPVSVPMVDFARAITAFVHRPRPTGPDHTPDPRRTAAALLGWAEAVARGDRHAPTAPPDWTEAPGPIDPGGRPLPVSGLFHLAYRRAWRRTADGLRHIRQTPEGLALFDRNGMTLIDREDGRITAEAPGLRPVPGVDPTRWALDADGAPVALQPDGSIRWRGHAPGDVPFGSLFATDAIVVAVSLDGQVRGLDTADGTERWRFEGHFGEVLGLVVRRDRIWFTAEDGFVYGLDGATGAVRFAVAPGGETEVGPVLGDGVLLQVRRPGPHRRCALTALDPVAGRPRWSTELDGEVSDPPLAIGGRVLCVADDGVTQHLFAVAPGDGRLLWRRPLDAPSGIAVDARALLGLVLLKAADGTVTALDARTGMLRWLLPGDDPESSLHRNTPIIVNRGLFLVPGTTIRAVDPQAGRVVHVIDCDELVPHWMAAWPGGDLAIAEGDVVARYLLGGHLARVL